MDTVIASIISLLLGLITRDIYSYVQERLKIKHTTVRLFFQEISENEEAFLHLDYYVLIVRYGKDEVRESSSLINKVYKFEGINPKRVVIPVHKKLGVQFKCYVDMRGNINKQELRKFLEKNGFFDIAEDSDKAINKLWFLIPGYSIYKTIDGYKNNFCHPTSLIV